MLRACKLISLNMVSTEIYMALVFSLPVYEDEAVSIDQNLPN